MTPPAYEAQQRDRQTIEAQQQEIERLRGLLKSDRATIDNLHKALAAALRPAHAELAALRERVTQLAAALAAEVEEMHHG